MRLGLSNNAAQEFINNGITALNKLRTLSTEALDMLIKQITRQQGNQGANQGGAGIFIPFFSQQYIRAICFWANRMHVLGMEYTVQQITEQLAETWNEMMKTELEAAKVTTDIIKVPEAFKKDTKWRPWKESVITYLHSKHGHASLPLAYIIHEFGEPLPNVIYATTHDQLAASAILNGPEYHANNGIVFDLLQSLTLNGPVWEWINNFERVRDGRGAWKALITYYEGDSMKTRTKQECYDAIAKAVYKGNTRTFDFTTYVSIHQQAHQELLCLYEPVPENKKVRDFLSGLTDPQCANIKLNVLANPIYMNDFSLMINYCATAIDMIKKNDSSTRQISDVQSGSYKGGQGNRGGRNNNRGGRGGYGRGGRGYQQQNSNSNPGRGGREGRGRGRGRGHGRNDPNDQSIGRGYSRDDWNNLSQADKNRIYRARDRMETARTVAALLRDQTAESHADDVSTMVPSVINPPQTNRENMQQGRSSAQVSQVSLASIGQNMNRRQSGIGAYATKARKECHISSIHPTSTSSNIIECRAELDSHADTCGVKTMLL
jgi:hypothetical protein